MRPASRDRNARGVGRREAVTTEPGNGDRGGGAAPYRPRRRMAMSARQRCLAVLWCALTIVLAVTGTDAQPTLTVTMRLAEAEWHGIRQEVLPRFEAVCNCRVRAIDVPPETLVQRLRTMRQAGRMEIDLFAQDNMRLQELVDTALVAPFTSEEAQVEEAIYPSLLAVGVDSGVRYFLPF